MDNTAIRVENLSKLYRIGGRQAGYKTIRESITDLAVSPFQRLRRLGQPTPPEETIWALKDVSFEVKQGEVVGIIGPNGAGKTTLLKVLCRITEPTEGQAEIHGRVGSLLEVGTGFHPELTGRENIYLNGAILGMKRVEIDRKFDEIVGFAEIEKFLDTPVKRYSSGMYVRLAFAVAAHLEPEILLVDEVLAVGDAAFQKKCLGKMRQVAKEGRTVLFVSHNMAAVQRLCQTAYLLEQGEVVASGDAPTVVDTYHKRTTMDRDEFADEARDVPEATVNFLDWKISQSPTGEAHSCYGGDPCAISLRLVVRQIVHDAYLGIALWSEEGVLVWSMRSLDQGNDYILLQEGLYQVEFRLPQLPLKPGIYQLQVSANALGEGNLDMWYAQPQLLILPRTETGISKQWQGILDIRGQFQISQRGNHVGKETRL